MAESTPTERGGYDKTPRSYATEPPRPIDQMEDAPGVVVGPELNYVEPRHNTFIVSTVTMVLTSLITFYLPLFNGMMGGTFGGWHARRWGRAMGAALVNSLLVPAIVFIAYSISRQDPLRLFYGLGFDGWFILHVLGTFIGAAFGVLCRPLVDERRDLVHARTTTSPRGPVVTAEHSEVERAVRTDVVDRRDS